MRTIKVTCAIIENEDKVLCTQRSEKMKLPLKWEFPGGKVEENEGIEECLLREIKEELCIDITIKKELSPSYYLYDSSIEICLLPFICNYNGGEIELREHKCYKWLTYTELRDLDWATADIQIVEEYLKIMR